MAVFCSACASDRVRHDNPSYEGPNFYESDAERRADAAVASGTEAPAIDFFAAPLEDGSVAPACTSPAAQADVDSAQTPLDLECPPLPTPNISNFTFLPGATPTGVVFGAGSAFPGGTFFYPDASSGLHSDVTGNDWHLFGTVTSLSGFGLFLNGCRELDASAYGGIGFRLWGHIDAPGSLVFFVGSAAHQVSSSWLNTHKASPSDPDEAPNLGRCVPLVQRYDNTCREPRIGLPVSDAPSSIQVLWRDLVDGCPTPSPDASQITAIAWYFPPSTAGYGIDVHIDDLRFTELGVR